MNHTPGPWKREGVNIYTQAPANVKPHIAKIFYGDTANAALIAAAPEMYEALKGLLAQQEGPAMVWGDGRGNDGTKTGLSHEEFNQLLKKRIDNARAAIAKAEGKN